MPAIILPQKWRVQPQVYSEVDFSHELLAGCIAMQVFAPHLFSPGLELKGKSTGGAVTSSGAEYKRDRDGAGLYLPTSGYWQMSPTWDRSAITNKLTSALLYKWVEETNVVSQFVLGDTLANGVGGSTYNWGHYFANTANTHTFFIHNGTTGVNTPLVPYVQNKLSTLIGTYDGATISSYFDGVKNTASQTGNVNNVSTYFALEANRWANIAQAVSGIYYSHILLNRCWSDGEAQAYRENPWQVFKKKSQVTYFDVGSGGSAALESAATATATASATLTTQIPITAAAAVVSSASGGLSTGIPLSGQASIVTLANGVLTTTISLSADAIVAALAQAGLDTAIPLIGSASAAAQAQADLTAGTSLSGAATALASAMAALTTQIDLSGSALAEALATGALSSGSDLSGTATAQASAAGSLYTEIPLAGAAQAYATASGGMTTIIPLAGAAASVSSATGDLSVEATFAGAAMAAALAGGTLTTIIRLDGAAVAQALASAAFASGIPATILHTLSAMADLFSVDAAVGPWQIEAAA